MINVLMLIYILFLYPLISLTVPLWQYHYGNSPFNALSKVPAEGSRANTRYETNIHTPKEIDSCIKYVLYIDGVSG